MATLISPGVSVTVTNESFFIPAGATSVPLFFIATADEKKQPDGILDAPGTFEHDVIRTVTSLRQSTELYGIPRFLVDDQGLPQNGDVRNEYGLFALNQYLGVGNRAYVIRANVNLNDNIVDIRTMWDNKIEEAAFVFENIASQYIQQYNIANGYVPGSGTSGYQQVTFNPVITGATATGLDPVTTYTADVQVDGVTYPVAVLGSSAATFTDLIGLLNTTLSGIAVASIASGALRITSDTVGESSTVLIVDTDLFSNLANYTAIATAVDGVNLYKVTVTEAELISLAEQATDHIWTMFSFDNLHDDYFDAHTLTPCAYPVFANGFSNPSTGCYAGFIGMANEWVANSLGSVVPTEWTPSEGANMLIAAADDFKYTQQFFNQTSLGANDAARRVAVVTALQASINSNTDIRGETYEYNLVVCPGFWETADELLSLTIDINEEAFVICDTPFNMDPEEVVTWAATSARMNSTNIAYYYPHGIASNLDGNNVFCAASGIALRTLAYSDSVSEVWFAPAGTRRGLVSGVSQVGYITGQLGTATTFVETALNLGQRDNLYKYFTNVNPIVFFPGRGILVWGQKTSAPDASALDRINVVRLVMYVRRQLRKNTMSFVFEPNDQLTRDSLKAVVDSFLSDLVVKRGLYDYATICDESNNTPDRIDRNEMYIDIALKPVKAAEFIYIPIRIVNTGTVI